MATSQDQATGERPDQVVVLTTEIDELDLLVQEDRPLLFDRIRQLFVETRVELRIGFVDPLHQATIALRVAIRHDCFVDVFESVFILVCHLSLLVQDLPDGVEGAL